MNGDKKHWSVTFAVVAGGIAAIPIAIGAIHQMADKDWHTTRFWVFVTLASLAVVWGLSKISGKHLMVAFYCITSLVLMGLIIGSVIKWLSGITLLKIIAFVMLVIASWAIYEVIRQISGTLLDAIIKIVKILFIGSPKVLLFAFILFLSFTFSVEAKPDLVAVVNCEHWKAPHVIESEVTTMDVRHWCSMYSIYLHNNKPGDVNKPVLWIPDASCIEVKQNGKTEKTYENASMIPLPSLPSGTHIDIKAWATCKANRPNAERIRIIYKGNRAARIDVRKPVLYIFQWLSQYSHIVYGCIGLVVCAVCIIIRRRRLFR